MPHQLQQRRSSAPPPTTGGPVNAVRCPHCGRPNDLRELDTQNLLDTGSEIVCGPVDGQPNTGHCGRLFVVVRIQLIKAVQVAPSNNQARRGHPDPQPARTVGPGMLRRLLGK
jgi:hypothetical protein